MKRAECRLGELIADEGKAGKLAKGTRGSFKGKVKGTRKGRGKAKPVSGRFAKNPPEKTLAEQGVDKNLADRARKAAALPEAA
jgi:hypothetical protein